MDFAKDATYSIKYKEKNYEKSKRIRNFISNNKAILSLSIIGLAIGTINCILIYNFIKVLGTL